MCELLIQPEHILLPRFRLFDLQSSSSIVIKLQRTISEYKTHKDISLLFSEITQHNFKYT